MKLVKVAQLGTDNKTFKTVSGARFFVPDSFRKTITPASYAIIITETFTSRTKTDENGAVVMHDGKAVLEEVAPWTRETVSFIGSKQEAVSAYSEPRLLELEADAFVKQASDKIATTQFDLSMVGAA